MADVVVLLRKAPVAVESETVESSIAAVDSSIVQWGRKLGLPVRPLHPGTTDPELVGWLHIVVPARHDANAVVQKLLADPTVAAAYVKPPDAAP